LLYLLKRSIRDRFLCSDTLLYRVEFKTKSEDSRDEVKKLRLNY
jgi:hypothetical protein